MLSSSRVLPAPTAPKNGRTISGALPADAPVGGRSRAEGVHPGRAEEQQGLHRLTALAVAPQDAEPAGPDVPVTLGHPGPGHS